MDRKTANSVEEHNNYNNEYDNMHYENLMEVIAVEDLKSIIVIGTRYNSDLLKSKSVKLIGTKGSRIFEKEEIDIDAKPCFTDEPDIRIGIKISLEEATKCIGKIIRVEYID